MNKTGDREIPRILWLDLETTTQGDILKMGAFCGAHEVQARSRSALCKALERVDALSAQADCLGGHNLLEHDLPLLARDFPALRLLQMPVIDTLPFSPLCFPENPYHRLVKDYKLVSASVNDPLSDARLAATLYDDEVASLTRSSSHYSMIMQPSSCYPSR